MNGKIVIAAALAGALAMASVAPTQAAEGRNAAFAAGVAAGVLGGAALGGGYAAPAYGYGYPAYGYAPAPATTRVRTMSGLIIAGAIVIITTTSPTRYWS